MSDAAQTLTVVIPLAAIAADQGVFAQASFPTRPPSSSDAVRPTVGAILFEQPDEWATQRSRYMTLEAISTVSDNATVRLSAVPA